MKNVKIATLLIGALCLMQPRAFAQSNDAKTMNVSISLTAPSSCGIAVDQDLAIAGVLPTSGSATYTANPIDGTISATGGSVDQASSLLGQLTVTVANASSATLSATAPASLNGNGGASLPFTLEWAQNNGGTYQAVSGSTVTLSDGTHQFRVGGTIQADASTQPGTYSGTVDFAISCSN